MINYILEILRKITGKHVTNKHSGIINSQFVRKPLPLGESYYNNVVSEYYYIDKTLLIKDLIDNKTKITLFVRPRRFGKTLNMFMLKSFFEISNRDTSHLFSNKKIWKEGKVYHNYQGKYPVVFLSFKDVKNDNWKDALSNIGSIISREYLRHSVLRSSKKVDKEEKEIYNKIVSGSSDEVEYCSSLLNLSIMLDKHYDVPSIIIIDEYDTPIQQGFISGYYDEVINFMRMFFSSALKDNIHMKFCFMTGILRISKENIFSGLNNIIVDTVLDNKYSEYFGFTQDEVKEMADCFSSSAKMDEIKKWYDGYRFGNTEIYNPWSVLNYFYYDCTPKPYWLNTSSNDIINEIVNALDEYSSNILLNLLQGNLVKSKVDTNFIYWSRNTQPSNSQIDMLLSFLLMTGYLKAVNTIHLDDGKNICELSIPNNEIKIVYKDEIIARKIDSIKFNISTEIQDALRNGNKEVLKTKLEELLISSVSYYDTAKESFFHGLFIGLCAVMNTFYELTSNRESGNGRYDICLRPKYPKYPAIIIELKATDNIKLLKEESQNALKQIENKRYAEPFNEATTKYVFEYGVAFCGKNADVEFKQIPV